MKPFLRGLAAAALVCTLGSCAVDNREVSENKRDEAFELLTKGQKLKDSGDLVLARDTFLKAAQVSERPVIYYEIANTNLRLGNSEQALPYYEKALALAPDYQLAKAEMDLVLLQLKEQQLKERPAPVVVAAVPAAAPEAAPVVEEPLEPETSIAPDEELEVEPAREIAMASEPMPTAKAPEPEPKKAEAPVAAAPKASEPAPKAPEPAKARPVASPKAEPPAQTTPEEPKPSQPAGTSAPSGNTGIFGALTTTLSGMSGDTGTGAANVTPEQVRGSLFPELVSPEAFDVEAEKLAAADAMRAGRFDEASRRWSRVLRVEPRNLEARLAAAEAFDRSGRTMRAGEEYGKALEVDAKNPGALFARGNFHRRHKQFQRARTDYEAVLQLDPQHARARNNLGAVFLDLGPAMHADARREFEAVTAQAPDFAPAWLNLALARDNSGAPAGEVLAALERYIRLVPSIDERTERWLQTLRAEARSGG